MSASPGTASLPLSTRGRRFFAILLLLLLDVVVARVLFLSVYIWSVKFWPPTVCAVPGLYISWSSLNLFWLRWLSLFYSGFAVFFSFDFVVWRENEWLISECGDFFGFWSVLLPLCDIGISLGRKCELWNVVFFGLSKFELRQWWTKWEVESSLLGEYIVV